MVTDNKDKRPTWRTLTALLSGDQIAELERLERTSDPWAEDFQHNLIFQAIRMADANYDAMQQREELHWLMNNQHLLNDDPRPREIEREDWDDAQATLRNEVME